MEIDDFENRGFPIQSLIVRFIIIVLIIFFVCIIFFAFNGLFKKNSDIDNKTSYSNSNYRNNVISIKEDAIRYFNNNKDMELPKRISLNEFLKEDNVNSLSESNEQLIDKENSYIKYSKLTDGVLLKIYLTDSIISDSTIVHIGEYSYCNGLYCEKKEIETTSKENHQESGIIPIKGKIEKGIYYNNIDNINQNHDAEYICKVLDGKYYDSQGKITTKDIYEESCNVKKYYCEMYNDDYYNKDGVKVSYDEYQKSCMNDINKEETNYSCQEVDGKYYDKDGYETTESEFLRVCGSLDSDDKKNQTNKKDIDYYEYQKTFTSSYLSNWSRWGAFQRADCKITSLTCSGEDSNCLKEIKTYKRKEKIGTYKKTYQDKRVSLQKKSSVNKSVCSSYNYLYINNVLYRTNKNEHYDVISNITKNTQKDYGNWRYKGRETSSSVINDTLLNHYVLVSVDDSNCKDTCIEKNIYYIYDHYYYTGKLYKVNSIQNCTKTSQTLPVFQALYQTVSFQRREPLYGDVCYISERYRTLENAQKIEKKWSVYNDQSLLENGWVYTGNQK